MTGKQYWRSLDELADSAEFRARLADEFPSASGELLDGESRRSFLKIMAASLALAGVTTLTGCRRWPKRTLVPESRRAEGFIPGVAEHFATSFEIGGVAQPLVVTATNGRPHKAEGNREHPASKGAASIWSQASVLELYDPARRAGEVQVGKPLTIARNGKREPETWAAFDADFARALETVKGGKGLVVLSEATSSLAVASLRQRLLAAYPAARWFEYESLADDASRGAVKTPQGRPLKPVYKFERADVIVSLDSDFLGADPSAVPNMQGWAAGRRRAVDRAEKWKLPVIPRLYPRLYVAEPGFSVTGTNADLRLPLKGSDVGILLAEIAAKVTEHKAAPGHSPDPKLKGREAFVAHAAADLVLNAGRGLIVVGPSQPASVHAAAHALNAALGNVGPDKPVAYLPASDPERGGHIAEISAAASLLGEGSVGVLLILGGNPAYDAPADLEFAKKIGQAKWSAHLSLFEDETSRVSAWHLARSHYLEEWGDARAADGTVTLRQPLIEPLYGGRSVIQLLSVALGEPAGDGMAVLRSALGSLLGGANKTAADKAFDRAVHDGFIPGTAILPVEAAAPAAPAAPPLSAGKYELVFQPGYAVWDGRFANNGWLQEFPHPLSKTTWDNPALVSPETAKDLGVGHGDVVKLSAGAASAEFAVAVVPGIASGVLAVQLGYGRTAAGHVGNLIGFDAGKLRLSTGIWSVPDIKVEKAGRSYALATTQDHYVIDPVGLNERRTRAKYLVREVTPQQLRDLSSTKEGLREFPGVHLPIYGEGGPAQPHGSPVKYDGHRWGLAIDLNVCTGCGACVIACMAENNIPIVGKKQVAMSREMHWLRIDRYFASGDDHDDAPLRAVHQPMMCVQCENAPCEVVCPVAATVHDHEGLNNMVYNRCIGTRYCANNCPYKVRRFNYLDWHSHDPRGGQPAPFLGVPDQQQKEQVDPSRKLMFNPEVTVRMRGVMEKCNYCVQRIQHAKIATHNAGKRTVPDGAIETACQQTCPTSAIVFGDLNIKESRVARLHESRRSYTVLEELNTRPRTEWLGRLVNSPVAAEEKSDAKGHG